VNCEQHTATRGHRFKIDTTYTEFDDTALGRCVEMTSGRNVTFHQLTILSLCKIILILISVILGIESALEKMK